MWNWPLTSADSILLLQRGLPSRLAPASSFAIDELSSASAKVEMGAFTLARLIALEALRRPRAVLATIMLALSAGFIILPDPGANYATMTLHGAPLVYTPAVMGIITGEMFIAFSMVL